MPAADAHDARVDLALIRQAARRGGEIAMGYFGRSPEVWMKAGQSPVTEADFAVDKYLRETLLAARPDYGWLSEETVADLSRLSARRTFVVDPIDGTRAFIDGRDVWCVSIAVVEKGRSIAGVLDCPAKSEIFEAVPGEGARLNGAPLSMRSPAHPPVIAGPKVILDRFEKAHGPFSGHAYVPSLAYRLAMLAAGRIDGTFVKARSHDWDLAAAALVLSEAGGAIRDATGTGLAYAGVDPVKGVLAASTGDLLDRMVATIADLDG